ncbi:MAG TPA: hypothetical protein VF746_23930 [Longimicrobium sp.]|jgi:hypothetical protein
MKLKLNLDDLRVDAFETTPADSGERGTVRALEQTSPGCETEVCNSAPCVATYDPTCEWSCEGTCGLSCNPTCHYLMETCGNSCVVCDS